MNQTYRHIYILGTHKLSLSYAHLLAEGFKNGELCFSKIFFIDSQQNQDVQDFIENSVSHGYSAEHVITTYEQFISEYLENFNNYHSDDAIIPDHTAPHVMLKVVFSLIERNFKNKIAELKPFNSTFATPFLHKSQNDAIWAMSYATWACPPECDEPKICPHLKSERHWDFNSIGLNLSSDPHIFLAQFSCQIIYKQVAYLAIIPLVQKISELIYEIQENNYESYLVMTHSHCHAILGHFRVTEKNTFEC